MYKGVAFTSGFLLKAKSKSSLLPPISKNRRSRRGATLDSGESGENR